MNIAMSISYGEKSYYIKFSSEKTIYINSDGRADVCIPDLNKQLEIHWGGHFASVKIIDGRKSTEISAPINKIILVEDLDITFCFIQASSYPYKINLPKDCEVQVGRSKNELEDGSYNNIIIDIPFVSRKHFKIIRKNGITSINELGSKNGILLNGRKIRTATLEEGDVLSIESLRFFLEGDILYIENAEDRIQVREIKKSEIRKKAQLSPGAQLVYKHSRSPRLLDRVMTEVIDIERPPQIGGPPKINWLNVLVTPMISVALMLVLVIVMGMSPIMLIMSGVMSLVSAVIAVINYNSQKKQHNNQSGLIDQKYEQYLQRVALKLKNSRNHQLNGLRDENPSPVECANIAVNRGTKLWNRVPTDQDFLSVRLGEGTIKSALTAKFQQSQVLIQESPLETKARELAQSSLEIKDAPILCELSSGSPVGVIGGRAEELQLTRNIITELAAAHSYDEVKIVAIVSKNEVQEWSWIRWLPHCADEDREKRYIFTSADEAENVLDEIDAELKFRAEEGANSYRDNVDNNIPHYVFVVAVRGLVEKHAIYKQIISGEAKGCSSIFIYDKFAYIPKECEKIIEVSQWQGEMYEKQSSSQRVHFKIDRFSLEEADCFARALAPVYIEADSSNASLPTGISFLEGYGVTVPEQLKIAQRWAKAQTFKSLSVPIAILPNGDTFCFDIHERAHGVHGMVAGMTRSGKTEMVLSWLLSLAVNYSPQDVSFVLIDFKGTSLIAPFQNLPHLAGSISDLDVPKGIDRNLASLKSEVHRRESLLAKYNVKTVNDLNKLYAQGHMPEKLPILIIVIDEFAEFKKNFPDFGGEIDSLTQKGGSLGMFTVLMAQKPGGVVSSQSTANIRFRWCLKVAGAQDSHEMLGRADASKIRCPGRSYVKIGDDEIFEQVQSFYSGAAYNPEKKNAQKKPTLISQIALNGKKIPCEVIEKHVSSHKEEAEIDVIVKHIAEVCREKGIASARKIWTEDLPARISLPELLKEHDLLNEVFNGKDWANTEKTAPIIGVLDNPRYQKRFPLRLDFADCGHTMIYGAPSSGKTTLLQTLIISLAMSRRPDQVNIYIMDFGGWNLVSLETLPHVGGIARDNQPERIKKLVLLLQDILYERQEKLSKARVGNVNAYRDYTGEQMTDIVVAIDNFPAVLKLYPELDDFFISLTSIGANYGIYMVTTATSPTAVPFRVSQNIKNALALEMIDKSDYTYIVGKIAGNVPSLPGRGYAKGNPPLEFQTALSAPGKTDKEVSENLRRLIELMGNCWQGERPRIIPEMPEQIPYGSIKTKTACLGLSVERVMPVCYDYISQHYLLISGTPGSGKSNMLTLIAKQIKDKLGGKLYVFDVEEGNSSVLKAQANEYLESSDEINNFMENLMGEMRARKAAKEENPKVSFETMILAIENYSRIQEKVSNETISRLLAIAKIGGGLGVYLLLADDSYKLASMVNKGESLAFFMAKAPQIVLLGGCLNDHDAISTKTPYSQKNIIVKENEGFYVCNDEAKVFKAMSSEEEVSL